MSRRGRHGRHQNPGAPGRPRPGAAQATERPASPAEGRIPARPDGAAERVEPVEVLSVEVPVESRRPDDAPPAEVAPEGHPAPLAIPSTPVAPLSARLDAAPVAPREPVVARLDAPIVPAAASMAATQPPRPEVPRGPMHRPDGEGEDSRPTCTVAQLRRFIKSRPWIPMHELRRRFGIWGGDDDVSPIRVGEHTLFIGLPLAEARLMAELLGGGDVGFELSLDPVTPIVVGVYPMRPVPRG